MKVVVYLLIFRQRGVVCAVAQTQNCLEIRDIHTSGQLPTPVSGLEGSRKHQPGKPSEDQMLQNNNQTALFRISASFFFQLQ